MKRRVTHLVPSRAWGGAEAVASTLCDLAVAHGWASSLDLPETAGARWTPTETPTETWLHWALRRRPHGGVCHVHLPWPDRLGPALLAARRHPVVVTLHLLPAEGPWPRDRLLGIPSTQVIAAAGRWMRGTRWVALSEHDAKTLERRLGGRALVIRNAPPEPRPSDHPLAWPADGVRLLSVGRLEAQKGFDRMLHTLATPALRALPWHWMIVGDGGERELLTSLCRTLDLADRVSFVGSRPAADGWTGAELLLAPSRHEGMPLVPMEAAEAGVAVLASDIPPHRELYGDLPDSLLPLDPARWFEAMMHWLTAPSARTALALAQRTLLGDNPREALWRAYEALYRAVLRD